KKQIAERGMRHMGKVLQLLEGRLQPVGLPIRQLWKAPNEISLRQTGTFARPLQHPRLYCHACHVVSRSCQRRWPGSHEATILPQGAEYYIFMQTIRANKQAANWLQIPRLP